MRGEGGCRWSVGGRTRLAAVHAVESVRLDPGTGDALEVLRGVCEDEVLLAFTQAGCEWWEQELARELGRACNVDVGERR